MKTQRMEDLIIESVTEEGKRFRPSDWIERISSALATFGPDQRLRYSAYVFPCVIQGEKCLVVSRELSQVDPAAFEYVMGFARENQLKIQEDRRNKQLEVPEDRRKGGRSG